LNLCELGAWIKATRRSKKLTQAQIAKLCNISRVTYGKLERGEFGHTSVFTLSAVLKTLGYEIDVKLIRNFGLPTLDEYANSKE
jgi:transcriptional regulator with XRE-family HTH domain